MSRTVESDACASHEFHLPYEASKLYADALVHDQAEIAALVSVYALISRMRVVSSSAVVEKAELVVRVDYRHVFRTEQYVSRGAKADGQPCRGSAARVQRGMPRGAEQSQSPLALSATK